MAGTRGGKTAERGLDGVVIGTNDISKVYGNEGRLIYCGYDIRDLARRASYEEVSYLLWNKGLPDRAELDEHVSALNDKRALRPNVVEMLSHMPKTMRPISALRSAVSLSSGDDRESEDEDEDARQRTATRLVARLPSIITAFERLRNGLEPIQPRHDLSHAGNLLYMLSGEEPGPATTRALDAYLVLLAEHGFNASTFSARVTASTVADMYSCITSAVGTLKGRAHGGANQGVMVMLEEIGSPDRAEAWVMNAIANRQRIMGIGHRVYKTIDPRGVVLRELAEDMYTESRDVMLETAIEVERVAVAYFEEHHPELKLYPNVDFYSAPVLHAAGIPTDTFTPLFAASRIAGWTAHVLEQYAENRLIRPRSEYVGPTDRPWLPIEER
jgi:citrate synthase